MHATTPGSTPTIYPSLGHSLPKIDKQLYSWKYDFRLWTKIYHQIKSGLS